MGCIGCLIAIGQKIYDKAQELKERKHLRHFDVKYIQRCYEVSKKFKYVYIVGLNSLIFLDYVNMKVKNEIKFNGTIKEPKFSDSDNSYTLEYGDDNSKTVLKLKIADDKITEISKASKSGDKKNKNPDYTYMWELDNGCSFVYKKSEFESSLEQPFCLIDSSGKTLAEIDFPKKINGYDATFMRRWNNDKLIVFHRLILKKEQLYSLALELYEINTLKKIGELEAKTLENREILWTAVDVLGGHNNTVIISIVYNIYVMDLNNFSVIKQFNLCKGMSFCKHIKSSENDTYYSMTKDYRFFKWKSDGTVLLSNCMTNKYPSATCAGFAVINDEKELLWFNTTRVGVDSLTETQ